ncbi:MAG: putative secreted protein, partial [uncultured Nocardioidaceae bacterium]
GSPVPRHPCLRRPARRAGGRWARCSRRLGPRLRLVGSTVVHRSARDGAGAAGGSHGPAGAPPERPPPDARPGQEASLAGVPGSAGAGPRGGHRRQPVPPRRRGTARRRAGRAAVPPGRLRHGLQRLLRTGKEEPGPLPAPRRRSAQHPRATASVGGPGTPVRGGRLDRPHQPAAHPDGRGGADRLHRRRRPSPRLRRPRRGDRPCGGRRHRPLRGRQPRPLPAGAGPLRRGRSRPRPGRPHPRRPAAAARQGGPGDQLRPRPEPRQRSPPAPGRLPSRRGRIGVAARLGRRGDLAVRSVPGGVPARGDAPHAGVPLGCL